MHRRPRLRGNQEFGANYLLCFQPRRGKNATTIIADGSRTATEREGIRGSRNGLTRKLPKISGSEQGLQQAVYLATLVAPLIENRERTCWSLPEGNAWGA
jgi:hypothetical protein